MEKEKKGTKKRAESKRMRDRETKGEGSDIRMRPERANSPANAQASWLPAAFLNSVNSLPSLLAVRVSERELLSRAE